MKTRLDKTGRTRQPQQDTGRCKIPVPTGGARTGLPTPEDCPPELSEIARAWWLWALEKMTKLGIAENSDIHSITLTANRYEDMVLSRKAAYAEPYMPTDRGGIVRNPAFGTYENAAKHFQILLGTLGLTPSARAKLGGEPVAEDPFNSLASAPKNVVPMSRHA